MRPWFDWSHCPRKNNDFWRMTKKSIAPATKTTATTPTTRKSATKTKAAKNNSHNNDIINNSNSNNNKNNKTTAKTTTKTIASAKHTTETTTTTAKDTATMTIGATAKITCLELYSVSLLLKHGKRNENIINSDTPTEGYLAQSVRLPCPEPRSALLSNQTRSEFQGGTASVFIIWDAKS